MRIITKNTVVVGSGAAGLSAADRLWSLGQKDICIVTENMNGGASRNAGSDKQTYYKLTLCGGEPDSVRAMAEDLFAGQCVDGDLALCEAALSAPCFLRLAELGVPFPHNEYGEYVGYKTDHDPRQRATSAGPYTSRLMTQALERSVRSREIEIFDHLQVIRILGNEKKIAGLLCLDLNALEDPDARFVALCCGSIVLATGGPAGMYADSAYPEGHFGATGLALRAGAAGRNLTEWQYGLASRKPRWNVSGTYMQVLPRFVSTLPDGSDEREFLLDFFADRGDCLSKVFLKGYQWPFDVNKVADGSSVIDILVWLEKEKGRRVWLDYTKNPGGAEIDFSSLSPEARTYLEKAGACFGTPFTRLRHMNEPAADFYREHGADLEREPLEITLCAQHNNGGLAVDCHWQTNLEGLFAVGEAAGTHGVRRPGGSALNAGQAGALRAAQCIAANQKTPDRTLFDQLLPGAVREAQALCQVTLGGRDTAAPLWNEAAETMSRAGAAFREREAITGALAWLEERRRRFSDTVRVSSPRQWPLVFRLEEFLLCQTVYLSAMLDYMEHQAGSRGSALYTDPRGTKPYASLPDRFTFRLDDGEHGDQVQEVSWANGNLQFHWRRVRPLPEAELFFENVWRQYRESHPQK